MHKILSILTDCPKFLFNVLRILLFLVILLIESGERWISDDLLKVKCLGIGQFTNEIYLATLQIDIPYSFIEQFVK